MAPVRRLAASVVTLALLAGVTLALLAGATLALVAGASLAIAGRADYVGSSTCGTCHPEVLAAWQATAHARAGASLGPRPPARCLSCHGTGDAPAGRAYFAEVGCEACHGPGAHYATADLMRNRPLAEALGLVDLGPPAVRAALCARCHGAPSTRLVPLELSRPVHPRASAASAASAAASAAVSASRTPASSARVITTASSPSSP